MKSSKFFAVAALSALAAFGSVAQARTVAGEVGMIEVPTQSTLERSVVRTQAADAVRQGLVPSGEASVVRAQAPAALQRGPCDGARPDGRGRAHRSDLPRQVTLAPEQQPQVTTAMPTIEAMAHQKPSGGEAAA
jgi:hypothetical protein